MQPPQDPTNSLGSPFSQSEQPSTPLPPDSQSPADQWHQPPPYPQTAPPFAPPVPSPQGSYPPGEEAYYQQRSQDGGPVTQYRARTQDKLTVPSIPPRRNGWKAVSLVLLVLVLVLAAVTAFALLRPSGSTGPAIGNAPASAPTQQTNPTNVATTTTVPSPAATPQTGVPVPSGTIPENLQLTCGVNCDDPIHVTITTIQVDDGNGNMVWNISLKNVSGNSMGYGIDTFELLASGSQTQIHATFSQSSGTLANSDPLSIQGIFSFVPVQNTTYTLTVVVEENPFNGPQITFDPAQITNL